MNYFNKHKKNIAVVLVLILLSLLACITFFHSGFPKTDDGNWMIIRFSAFYQALKDGEMPVRWLGRLNNGYGYPVADFLYPGFMYLGIPLAVITSSFVSSIKILFVSSLVASAVGMFLFLHKKFDNWLAFVGALVYLYSPYHLYDATVRGSLGEVLALAIVPFVFWLIERGSLFFAGIAVGLLILAHNTLALLFLPVIVLYSLLIPSVDKKNAIISIIGGVGMSAFFWLPALVDLQYTVFSQTTVSDWSHYFASLQVIGIMQLVIIVGIVVIFLLKAKERKKNSYSKYSSFPYLWNYLPLFKLSSFTFRLDSPPGKIYSISF